MALLLVGWGAAAADPDAPRDLVVSARAFAAIPSDAVLAVEPRDDTDENLQLRDVIAARVAQQRRVAADAPLLMRFSTTIVSNRDAQTGSASTRGPGGRGGRGGVNTGMLSGRNGGAAQRPSGEVKYRISATVEPRSGGTVLWKGEVTAILGDSDARALPAKLATALVEHLGQTFESRPASTAAAPAPAR